MHFDIIYSNSKHFICPYVGFDKLVLFTNKVTNTYNTLFRLIWATRTPNVNSDIMKKKFPISGSKIVGIIGWSSEGFKN